MQTETPDYLSMPDEEFQNLMNPSPNPGEEVEEEIETPEPEVKETVDDREIPDDTDDGERESDPSGETEDEEVSTGEDDPDPEKAPEEEDEGKDPPSKEDGKEPEVDPEKEEEKETSDTDYKGFYEKVMAPFTANGKTIQLNGPEEVIQLMQMGANYTRKMQAIAPHRKILLMLENNNLLDEDKLSYLIDIDKKNPDAIKKLVKDSGIDPIDIDPEEETTYRTGNHRVSDEEAAFRGVLEELGSNPHGKETLQLINSQWDHASKEVLWNQPEIMQVIHEQRNNGIYDRISTEVERQRTLGMIPPQVPFLQAYKEIGEGMAQSGAFNDLVPQKAPATPVPQQPQHPAPVARRVASPKPAVSNGDKASAASPTRSTPRKTTTIVNPLSLPDDEFEKQFAAWRGRV